MPSITTKYDYDKGIVSLIKTVYNTKYRQYEIIKPKTIYITSLYNVITAIKVNYTFAGKTVKTVRIPTNIKKLVNVTKKTEYGKPITKYKGITTTPPANQKTNTVAI